MKFFCVSCEPPSTMRFFSGSFFPLATFCSRVDQMSLFSPEVLLFDRSWLLRVVLDVPGHCAAWAMSCRVY